MPGTLLLHVYLFIPYNYTQKVIIFILPMRELRPKRGSLLPKVTQLLDGSAGI